MASDNFDGAAGALGASWADAIGIPITGTQKDGSGHAISTTGYVERAGIFTPSTSDVSEIQLIGTTSTGNSRGALVRGGELAADGAYCGLLEGNAAGNYTTAKIMVRGTGERLGISQDITALALARSNAYTVRLSATTDGSHVDLALYVIEYSAVTPVASWADADASRLLSGHPGFSMPWVDTAADALLDNWTDGQAEANFQGDGDDNPMAMVYAVGFSTL